MTIDIAHRFVDVAGLRLHVAEAGAGPPLVLLHGWPEYWETWSTLIGLLHGRFRLIAPDLRGFGLSDKPSSGPAGDCTPGHLADDLLGILDALGLERVGLVSHDVGAFAAQTFARRHPERLQGLFFFDCPHPGIGSRWIDPDQVGEIWYQSFNQQPWAAELVGSSREACRLYVGHFLRHWAHDKHAFGDLLERWVDNFMLPGNLQGGFNWYRSIAAVRRAMMAGTAPVPAKIATRSRFLWGRHDPIIRAAWTDRLGEFFADPVIGFAENSGHFVHVEEPDLAAAAIADFFDQRT